MNIVEFIQGQYLAVIAGGLGGVFTAWLSHRVLNRRGTFSYFVTHSRVGLTTDDAIFGKVSAQWNGNEIPNLYISTIELKNESLNDYENVLITAYSSDTNLLSEQTQILDSPNILQWSDPFRSKLHVEPGSKPTPEQQAIYNGQREYVVPVLNRGQSIRLTFLNSAKQAAQPTIWLSASLKGVRVKFRVPQPLVFGVPRPQAALAGVMSGIVVTGFVAFSSSSTFVAGMFGLVFGLAAQLPGAYLVRFWRKIINAIGG